MHGRARFPDGITRRACARASEGDAGKIADEVIAHLSGLVDAEVTVPTYSSTTIAKVFFAATAAANFSSRRCCDGSFPAARVYGLHPGGHALLRATRPQCRACRLSRFTGALMPAAVIDPLKLLDTCCLMGKEPHPVGRIRAPHDPDSFVGS